MVNVQQISELKADTVGWTIVVRCTRKIVAECSEKTPLCMDLVLMDMQGSHIHGYVGSSLVNRFCFRIHEGDVYSISNVEVVPSPNINPLLTNTMMINFLEETIVSCVVDPGLPLSPYKFVPLDQINNNSYPEDGPLFDCVGTLIEIDDSMMYGDGSGADEYIRFLISDQSKNQHNFFLFGPYSNEVKGYVDLWSEGRLNKAILIISLCDSTMFNGQFVLCNFDKVTRVSLYNLTDVAVVYSKIRRDLGRYVNKNGIDLDNRFVVPHNSALLKKYGGHINVEWCNRSRSIKYLFKYVHKGNDRTTAVFYQSYVPSQGKKVIDEIKQYFDCRYISASEAAWRLFAYEMHFREPNVIRLGYHCHKEQNIMFRAKESTKKVLLKSSSKETMFTAWLDANSKYPEARSLTYAEFPQKFVWNDQQMEWRPRQRGIALGRLAYMYPGAGELYYLRILLNIVRGCTSFDDVKTYDGKTYTTYKEACFARGLLDDDKEYIDALKEASKWDTDFMLRTLFVNMLTCSALTNPEKVWEECKDYLSVDVLKIYRNTVNNQDVTLSQDEIYNLCLQIIEEMMKRQGQTLKDIPNMPYPKFVDLTVGQNSLLAAELSYDRNAQRVEYDQLVAMLNEDQRKAYKTIVRTLDDPKGQVFFLYGYGGTGKTFVWKTLSAAVRARGDIVLNVASSGIASLLLPGGRTAHSRLKIPISLHESSTCNIKKQSDLGKLIIKTKLIIWDEAPMMHRNCFEALDRTMRDIMSSHRPEAEHLPFGGKVVVLGGDFRQILPVIPKGTRQDIVHATINSSDIWINCKVLRLTKNMRLQNVGDGNDGRKLREFSDWLSSIGDGAADGDNDGEIDIEIPNEYLITQSNNYIQSIVEAAYPSFHEHIGDINFLDGRAILAPTLDDVNEINDYMVAMHNTDERIYLSSDSIVPSERGDNMFDQMHSVEFLNTIKCSGLPNHELKLKVGVPVMLLRNIDASAGLCNGTRLVVTQLGNYIIQAKVLGGNNSGEMVFIPRIPLTPSDTKFPFSFQRRQFPIMISYAMTINKSQGQSLTNVAIYLKKPVFTHGQLYVALSRVTNTTGLKLLLCDERGRLTNRTTNVVYKEVFQNL